MSSLVQKMIDINPEKSFIEIHLQDLDKQKIRLKLTSPLVNVWRLQGAPVFITSRPQSTILPFLIEGIRALIKANHKIAVEL